MSKKKKKDWPLVVIVLLLLTIIVGSAYFYKGYKARVEAAARVSFGGETPIKCDEDGKELTFIAKVATIDSDGDGLPDTFTFSSANVILLLVGNFFFPSVISFVEANYEGIAPPITETVGLVIKYKLGSVEAKINSVLEQLAKTDKRSVQYRALTDQVKDLYNEETKLINYSKALPALLGKLQDVSGKKLIYKCSQLGLSTKKSPSTEPIDILTPVQPPVEGTKQQQSTEYQQPDDQQQPTTGYQQPDYQQQPTEPTQTSPTYQPPSQPSNPSANPYYPSY